jgi:hypothetical protein
MRRRLSNREYVLAGLFALIALFPLATATDGADLQILPPLGMAGVRPHLNGDRLIPTGTFPILEPTLGQLIEMQSPR